MKFKNDGENNALSLSLRFVDTLLADTGLIPTSGQLIGKGNQFWEKRTKHFDSICSSELDKYALKKYQSKKNQEREPSFTLSMTKITEKTFAVATYGNILEMIMNQSDIQ